MRIRAVDSNGDMTFGLGGSNFLVDSPAAVAQSVQSRFLLWTGQWFLDTTAGMPYSDQVLGNNTQSLYDAAIIQRLLDTPGVSGIVAYDSNFDGPQRSLTVSVTLATQYSINVDVTIPISIGAVG